MVEYTNIEYLDMVLVHGEASGNGRVVVRIYQERNPYPGTPPPTLFGKVIQWIRKRGTLNVNRTDCGTRRRRRIPNFEEDVPLHVERPRQRVPEPLGVELVCFISTV